MTMGVLSQDSSYLDLDPSHYYTREDRVRLPVHDAYNATTVGYNVRQNTLMTGSRPRTHLLRVFGQVLTEACADDRYAAVADTIMSLYPGREASTDAFLIGNEPTDRLWAAIMERHGNSESAGGHFVLDALARARGYDFRHLPQAA